MDGVVRGLSGLNLIGRFGGVDDSQAVPAVLVDFDYRDAGGQLASVTRRCEYSGYSSKTGEITEVGKAVSELSHGEVIAVSVWVNRAGQQIKYRAQGIVRLPVGLALAAEADTSRFGPEE